MQINQPTTRPACGLTFAADTFVVLDTAVTVGVQGARHLQIIPINCFPLSRFADKSRFSMGEATLVASAIRESNDIRITIPEPRSPSSRWLPAMQFDTPKPGWIWTDTERTIDELLVAHGSRQARPSYPVNYPEFLQGDRPPTRPDPGLTMRVDRPVRIETGSADVWRIVTSAGNEMVVSLIDCYCRDGDYSAYEHAWHLMHQHAGSLAMTVPTPAASNDWIGSLRPGTEHAGWIWLDEKTTLNRALVQSGMASNDSHA